MFGHKEGEFLLKKHSEKKYTGLQISTKFGQIWVSSCLFFSFIALNHLLLFVVCPVAINILEPRAFNPEFQHIRYFADNSNV